MNRSTYLLVALALVLSSALTYVGHDLPPQAWALVGLCVGGGVGAAVKRPQDTSPDELARVLEQRDPTAEH